MAVEVELKARIDDIDPVKERLSAIGSRHRSHHKSDTYWFSPLCPTLRVRREQGLDADGAVYGSVVVTLKTKTISGGIEVNDEREFTVSDAGLFEELLDGLGMRVAIRKEKTGWAWDIPSPATQLPPILAELSMVTGLGWFLELEIVCPDHSGQLIEESRKRLLALLEQLEIPASRIESRTYSEMLTAL